MHDLIGAPFMCQDVYKVGGVMLGVTVVAVVERCVGACKAVNIMKVLSRFLPP